MKIIRASQVTLQHRLVIAGRTVGLEKITYTERIGFYSPITLSGYLTVNNVSTSVYVDWWVASSLLPCLPILFIHFSLQVSHGFFHLVAGPFRVYYHAARWFFGNNHVPFGTALDNELHPISIFIITNFESIRLFFTTFPLLMPTMFIVSASYFTRQIFVSVKNKYFFMLKYQEQWRCRGWFKSSCIRVAVCDLDHINTSNHRWRSYWMSRRDIQEWGRKSISDCIGSTGSIASDTAASRKLQSTLSF